MGLGIEASISRSHFALAILAHHWPRVSNTFLSHLPLAQGLEKKSGKGRANDSLETDSKPESSFNGSSHLPSFNNSQEVSKDVFTMNVDCEGDDGGEYEIDIGEGGQVEDGVCRLIESPVNRSMV